MVTELLGELRVAAISLSAVSISALLPLLSSLCQGWLLKPQCEVVLGGRGTPWGCGGVWRGTWGFVPTSAKHTDRCLFPGSFFFKASIVAVGA